jgi:hypothetical protein
MKSFFEDLKMPAIIASSFIIIVLIIYSAIWYSSREDLKLLSDLISVCKFEIKKQSSYPDKIVFEDHSEYAIPTSNPNIWHVYLKAAVLADNNVKIHVGTFCRMIKVGNNLQVDRWEYHIEK